MTGNNTAGVQSFRVDADYRDPLAATTIHPFRVVHRWTEQGKPKTHTETDHQAPREVRDPDQRRSRDGLGGVRDGGDTISPQRRWADLSPR